MKLVAANIRFREGALGDYLALAHHHYRPQAPATCVRVLAVMAGDAAEVVGALVVSMPVLNASWRDILFTDGRGGRARYRSGDRRADAARLNAEVRTISRVVVDPRYRGLGIGTSLVRRYLRKPLTPVTEALATMGAFSRFFEAAGMTPCAAPACRRDLRLADALAALGIESWMLGDPRVIPAELRQSPLLLRELRRWAQGSRGTRPLVEAVPTTLLRHAARIFHPPTVFVAVRTRDKS